jgi:quinol monooxygenase YgiN
MEPDTRLALLTLSVSMHFAPAEVERAIQLLLSSVGRTEATSGCRTCTVARDAADACRVQYHETWDSRTAFRRHVRTEEFRRVLIAMDLSCEEPEVVVGDLSGSCGLSCLQDMLQEPESEPR